MSKRAVVLLLFLVSVVPAVADEHAISALDMSVSDIDNLAVTSTFNAATHTLSWSRGGIATMFYNTGNTKYRVTVAGTFTGLTDISSGGLASAKFDNGTFGITFYAMTDPGKVTALGSLTGEIYPGWKYIERETQENPSQLYGSAPMRLNTFSFNGYHWSEGLGAMGGVTSTTTNLGGNLGNISDYQSNWFSNNSVVRLLADESGIPEPATIALLGLGATALISRKKRS